MYTRWSTTGAKASVGEKIIHLFFLESYTQYLELLNVLRRKPRPNLVVPRAFGVEVVVFLAVVQLR